MSLAICNSRTLKNADQGWELPHPLVLLKWPGKTLSEVAALLVGFTGEVAAVCGSKHSLCSTVKLTCLTPKFFRYVTRSRGLKQAAPVHQSLRSLHRSAHLYIVRRFGGSFEERT